MRLRFLLFLDVYNVAHKPVFYEKIKWWVGRYNQITLFVSRNEIYFYFPFTADLLQGGGIIHTTLYGGLEQ